MPMTSSNAVTIQSLLSRLTILALICTITTITFPNAQSMTMSPLPGASSPRDWKRADITSVNDLHKRSFESAQRFFTVRRLSRSEKRASTEFGRRFFNIRLLKRYGPRLRRPSGHQDVFWIGK